MDGGLTDQLETEQKYDVDLDFAMPDLGGLDGLDGGSGFGAPETYLLVARYYDTDDLRLAAAKVTLRRRTGGPDAAWHLKLPVGGDTRREVHAPLGSEGDAVPAGLASLVAGWTGGRRLRPVATLRTRRTVRRITGTGGEALAEVADDLVTAHREALPGPPGGGGLPETDLAWREVEVELVSGPPAILTLAGRRLRAAGARPSGSASKLGRLLAAPAAAQPAGIRPPGAAQTAGSRPPGPAQPAAGRPRSELPGAVDLGALAAIAESHQLGGGQPGLVYGIVAGGALVEARGLGGRWLGGPVPDADTVFRIASMTKSFTAAALLALRDDGALALDDPAEDYVPALRGLRPATADSPRISVRHLLTMTAGLPTDDPWGDRQQGMPHAEFAEFLAGGVRFAWAPGTRFDYANLGYAILGAVVAAASGTSYEEFVRARLLGPLGMLSTGFDAAEFGAARLARGYRRGGTGWEELAPDPSGAFASMGGVFSTVTDLARWVHGFAAAFPPGAEDAGGPHPLRRASRREMQLPQVALPPQPPAMPAGPGPGSYGLGLFVEDDAAHGRIVSHSGGYPGFGSHMRWHLASGTGVIVLANGTYAPAHVLASKLLDAVLRPRLQPAAIRLPATTSPSASGSSGPAGLPASAGFPAPAAGSGQSVAADQLMVGGPVPAPGGPWPETLSAQREVMGLLLSWDDAAAARLFSPNVAQDEPFDERRRKAELIRQRIGDFRADEGRPAEFDSPAHCRWWLRGERGVVQAEIRLTPEWQPRVQSVVLAVPPDPDSPLGRLLDQLVSLLNEAAAHGDRAAVNDGPAQWPSTMPVSPSLDTGLLIRQLAAAAAWAGRCRRGAITDGNGETSVTVELDGETARLILTVSADPVQHLLQQADITLAP
jgi:CubicO group peptidase (beta-lactamase class C family)